MTTSPAEVAVSLTDAQRRALINATYSEAKSVWSPAGWYVSGDKRVRIALCRLGLIRDYLRHSYPLTVEGLAVRSILTEKTNG
jgi:hypothetical protein